MNHCVQTHNLSLDRNFGEFLNIDKSSSDDEIIHNECKINLKSSDKENCDLGEFDDTKIINMNESENENSEKTEIVSFVH